jgi:hypothetical protein
MATMTSPSQDGAAAALTWFRGIVGAFYNAFHFMKLFDHSDRELASRGLDRGTLVDSYIHSFDRD